ncbi:MAG: NUDIX hydrolase [Pseudonocardiaceae bacterium]
MSITTDEIRDTVTRYLAQHPKEAEHLAPLTRALEREVDLTSRKTFDGGHVTCGAVVIDDTNRLLLVQHKALGRWLLPRPSPGDRGQRAHARGAASWRRKPGSPGTVRSARPARTSPPIDVDVHLIPANPAKDEPEHWHADVRWAF